MNTVAKSLLTMLISSAALIAARGATIVDDTWADGSRTNTPASSANSVWFADSAASLTAVTGSMIGSNTNTSRQWETHFTTDPATPVQLAVGDTLTLTLTFTPTGVGTATSKGLRVGLFDYADGGTRITSDGSTQVKNSGANVSGYFTGFNFSQALISTPIEFRVRTNLTSVNLLGSTGDYIQAGSSGPATVSGGFANGTSYTLTFAIKHNAGSNTLTTTIVGGTLNLTHTVNDTAFSTYTRFDTVAIRANTDVDTATNITFTHFKVDSSSGGGTVTPIPIFFQKSGTNLVLTWTNATFGLLSSSSVTGAYSAVSGASSPYTNPIVGTQKYFRLLHP